MNPADTLATLRAQVIDIILGTVFLSIGAAACAIAAIRWRRGVRILVWWGIWSVIYGLQALVQTPAILTALPHAPQIGRALRDYSNHVPASGLRLARLAGTGAGQSQGSCWFGNLGWTCDCHRWCHHVCLPWSRLPIHVL